MRRQTSRDEKFPCRFWGPDRRQLALHEIDCLDAVRSLIDRGNSRIAHELGGPCLLDKVHAAIYLHADRGGLGGDIRAIATGVNSAFRSCAIIFAATDADVTLPGFEQVCGDPSMSVSLRGPIA